MTTNLGFGTGVTVRVAFSTTIAAQNTARNVFTQDQTCWNGGSNFQAGSFEDAHGGPCGEDRDSYAERGVGKE